MFGMTSLITYSLFTWVPKILTEAGRERRVSAARWSDCSPRSDYCRDRCPALCGRIANPYPVVVAARHSTDRFYRPALRARCRAWLWILLVGLGPSTFPMR